MLPVPFTIGDLIPEDGPVRGRISFGGASVTLELDTSRGGRELEAPRKVVIGVEEFAGCRFQRGLMACRLHLRTATLGALGGVPGAYLDLVTLRFARRDRNAAEALADRLANIVVERAPRPARPRFSPLPVMQPPTA